jgi:hypothetical protein
MAAIDGQRDMDAVAAEGSALVSTLCRKQRTDRLNADKL